MGEKKISRQSAPPSYSLSTRLALKLYQGLWHLVCPLLRVNSRLNSGYDQRVLKIHPGQADLWIQAASVGEAYLAWELVKELQFSEQTTILLTTNTSQGFDILKKIGTDDIGPCKEIVMAYCPFDQPSLIAKALAIIKPRAIVLLESELWPGLMAGCKKEGVKLLVVNGRMTPRSLKGYLRWPTIWIELRPDRVLAMSGADGKRFSALFGPDIVATMANIKFDRIQPLGKEAASMDNPLHSLIAADEAFVVLGSVQEEEEGDVSKILTTLYEGNRQLIVGLFPRHMQRLGHWQQELDLLNLPWQLRSQSTTTVAPGTIILWDSMGELEDAYALARAAFVGGSLAPLGGQNFLEPLSCGIRPVIGPHWTDFTWIGADIVDQGLVHEAPDWQGVARYLMKQMSVVPERRLTQKALQAFVQDHQGGTRVACQEIQKMLARP